MDPLTGGKEEYLRSEIRTECCYHTVCSKWV